MTSKKPWDFHADLQDSRISDVGRLVAQTYQQALDYYEESKGDNRWSHGCRRYVWVCKSIREAIKSKSLPFLGIVRDIGNTFIFKIGEVPVKFKRDDPDEPSDSVIRQAYSETQQLSLLEFSGLEDPCELTWRLLVEDDYDGEVLRIVFAGIDQYKTTKCFWEIPQNKIRVPLVVIDEFRDQGVELDRPQVNLRVNASEDDSENAREAQ